MALHPFVKAVDAGLRRHCRIGKGARLLVAVSGGADSVALLRAVCDLSPRRGWELLPRVIHINHRVRPDSDADACFVADLAQQLVPEPDRRILMVNLDPARLTGNVEAALRRARHAALLDAARQWRADAVALGHHGDDQLETMLMRLLRGAATGGLAGMAWRSRRADVTLVRPMLGVTHEEAVAYLTDLGQPWREDATNADVTRWRARLRREVLPVLRSLRPDAAAKAVAVGQRLRHGQRVVELAIESARRLVQRDADGMYLDRDAARQMPTPVLGGVLRHLLTEAGVPPDRLGAGTLGPIVRAVRDRVARPRRFDLPADATLQVTARHVKLSSGG